MEDIRDILEGIRDGSVSVDEAVLKLKEEPFEDIGFAKVDLHRKLRQGFAEVIYGRVPGDILEELVITHDHCYKKFVFEPENDFFLAKDEKGRNKRYFSIVSNKTEVRTYYQFNLLNQL